MRSLGLAKTLTAGALLGVAWFGSAREGRAQPPDSPRDALQPCYAAAPTTVRPSAATARQDPAPQQQAPQQTEKQDPAWRSLFDGQTLGQWKSTNFGGEGEVTIKDGVIQMEMGSPLTGLTYQGRPPRSDYELQWEARRLQGIDFFAAMTFPVGASYCSFIAGGWAGAVVGISSIDNRDASENETTVFENLKNDQWYRFRVRVTEQRIICWIDKTRYVNVNIQGRKISTRTEVDLSQPLGVSAYECQSQLRNIRWRPLTKEEVAAHNADEALHEPEVQPEKQGGARDK